MPADDKTTMNGRIGIKKRPSQFSVANAMDNDWAITYAKIKYFSLLSSLNGEVVKWVKY